MDDNARAMQAQIIGLTAAVTLIADHHPNRGALLAALPEMQEALRNHHLFSNQPDWIEQIAQDLLSGVLRSPAPP